MLMITCPLLFSSRQDTIINLIVLFVSSVLFATVLPKQFLLAEVRSPSIKSYRSFVSVERRNEVSFFMH